jgi:hypothetical protein
MSLETREVSRRSIVLQSQDKLTLESFLRFLAANENFADFTSEYNVLVGEV